MRCLRSLVLVAAAGSCFAASVPAYGYYDAAPYGCAPSGYYGSEWFTGGIFIGAGPWFHERDGRGHATEAKH
jgi:hypothetical protein